VPLNEDDPMYGPPVSRDARLFLPSVSLRTCSVRRCKCVRGEIVLNFVRVSGALAHRI
jgi:hypothetical protein